MASCLPGGEGTQRPYGHRIGGTVPADVCEGQRQRAVLVQQVVGHHHGEGGRHPEVGQETDEQGGHDTDGDGPLWVLHLLS